MSLTKNNFLFTEANNKDTSEEQAFERKEQFRQNAKQWVANEEPPSLKLSVKEFTMIDGNTTSYSMNGIKGNAQTRVEQDVYLVLKN